MCWCTPSTWPHGIGCAPLLLVRTRRSFCRPPLTQSSPQVPQPPLLQVNTNQEAYRQQLRIFLAFVDQTRHLPALKQFLKLYTSISLTKLAGLMDMDSDNLSGQLQVLKVGCRLPGQGLAMSIWTFAGS